MAALKSVDPQIENRVLNQIHYLKTNFDASCYERCLTDLNEKNKSIFDIPKKGDEKSDTKNQSADEGQDMETCS